MSSEKGPKYIYAQEQTVTIIIALNENEKLRRLETYVSE